MKKATFGTRDYGEVTIERGEGATGESFQARSKSSNVTLIVDSKGDQASLTTYDYSGIVTSKPKQLSELREQVDLMLQQCDNVTRR